jgi:arylsulfatase
MEDRQQSSDRPNIVVILSDQHRADVIGAAGHPVVRTPNLDRLAADGYFFENLFCQAPLCVPARASLLTERYVRDHGQFDNRFFPPTSLPTTVQSIRDAGYHTTAIGKMHLWPHYPKLADGLPLMRAYGFEEVHEAVGKMAQALVENSYSEYLAELGYLETYREFIRQRTPWLPRPDRKPAWVADPCPLPPELYLDSWIGRQAVRWLEERSASDDPFFLWLGFPGPHSPWDAPSEYVRQYEDVDVPLDSTRRPDVPNEGPLSVLLANRMKASSTESATDERIRDVRRHYFANVTLIDRAIGEIQTVLERKGWDHNTWVVYSSDHGEMLGTHGLFFKQVPYDPAARVPLIVRPPRGRAGPVRVPDLFEHVDLSATLRSLAGAGALPGSAGRSFAPCLTDDAPFRARDVVVSENLGYAMWRTERYKLVAYEKDHQPLQLFDLAEDPDEDGNCVADPAYKSILADLSSAYVEPFLSSAPRRPGPDLVELQSGAGAR